MHWHKVVARFFLLLAIANFTFAGQAQKLKMHEMRVDLVTGAEKNVMQASEMGHTQSEELLRLFGRASTAGHLQSRVEPLQEEIILGAISGVFSGVANGIQKEILGTVSPGAYVSSSLTPPSPLLPKFEWRGSQTYSN